jgi:hypothetical protein
LNNFDDNFKVILLGYVPTELPYSDVELLDSLPAHCSDDLKRKILKYSKRRQLLQYLDNIMQPILNYQTKGLKIRIGGTKIGSFDIEAYISLVVLTGDTMALDDIAGTSHQKRQMKCRMCMLSDCVSPTKIEDAEWRNDDVMQIIGSRGATLLLASLKKSKDPQTLKKMKLSLIPYNIAPGENPIIKYFDWQRSHGISSFFSSLPPDMLHTVAKGYIEYAISWSMVCLLAVPQIFEITASAKRKKERNRLLTQTEPATINTNYSNNMAILDNKVCRCPMIESLVIFNERRPRFRRVSSLFSKPWRKENKGTAFISGSIEGYNLPILLFTLCFCINHEICPFDTLSHSKWTRNWNIGKVILNAMQSTLDLYFALRQEVQTDSSLDTMKKIIANSRAHLCLLWLLKTDLVMQCKRKEKDQSKTGDKQYFSGIKPHLVTHIPYFKTKFGAMNRTLDTQLLEKAHKDNVKINYEATNKNKSKVREQMLLNVKRIKHLQNIRQFNRENLDVNLCPSSSDSNVTACVIVKNKPGVKLYYFNGEVLRSETGEGRHNSTTFCKATNDRILNFNELTEFLFNYSREECTCDFHDYWIGFHKSKFGLSLRTCVQIKQNAVKVYQEDFYIWCDDEYIESVDVEVTTDKAAHRPNRLAHRVHSFVEVLYKDSDGNDAQEMCQVVAILSFSSKCSLDGDDGIHTHTDHSIGGNRIFLVIAWLQRAIKYSDLSYPCYKFNMDKLTKLTSKKSLKLPWLDVVPVEYVNRPAALIPVHPNKTIWTLNRQEYAKIPIKDLRFCSIPYEIAFSRNCDGFTRYCFDSNSDSMRRTTTSTNNLESHLDDDRFDQVVLSSIRLTEIENLVTKFWQTGDATNNEENQVSTDDELDDYTH